MIALSNIEESLYVIAYIDMLGTKKRIESGESTLTLRCLHQLYTEIIKAYTGEALKSEHLRIKIFSDNIIIAHPILNHDIFKTSCLNQMIAFAASFQIMAMFYQWPVRGGITIGKLYIDDVLVWGSGLVRAYQLESSANYPRIVIDKDILFPLVEKNLGKISLWKMDAKTPIVDSLEMFRDSENGIDMFRNGIMQLLNNAGEDARVVEKIVWMRDYYNDWCKAKGFTDKVLETDD